MYLRRVEMTSAADVMMLRMILEMTSSFINRVHDTVANAVIALVVSYS